MNNTTNTLAKQCINSLCRKADYTEFSTCRYCSFPYTPEPNRNAKSFWDNPMPLLKIGGLVASIFASFYLVSVFGQTAGSTGSTGGSYRMLGARRYGASASIPAALVVFFSQKMLASANDDIQSSTFALGRNPRDFNAYLKRGDAYYTRSMMNESLADYTSAIAVNPMSADAYDKRSIIEEALNLPEQALKDKKCAALYRK